ncbi:Cu2+-exporting ATPase [Peptoclostridium litorale DSM 5388]|uniref:P-type Cu(+) transporter n=1 Tax=Peptoclostridium litorale DSM 5388 TaxID=1121324 RepID=A0A069RKM9_PEPLI|nr:copper-translocating P-type ATPase [Peptoclostridium litorale]KDR96675.1 copper-exporting P-type ATPase B [Peptoclostridium litorale DSM 5388]SIN67837.1 Cu2+-exporting ATPase [Peptoclostridium litorale DSM 5388]
MQHSHSMHNHGGDKHSHHEEHDHIAHHEMMIEDFKKRFYVSIVVTIPILILSPIIQEWFGFKVEFYGSSYVLFLLASFLFFYGGWPFLTGLFNELKDKSPGMMTLIALAIAVAYLYSSAVVFGLEGKLFFWELATLIDVMLLGHWIEMKSVVSASNALKKLAELMPDEAHLLKGSDIVDISVSELSEGDIVLIRPGEKVPGDGVIVKGRSYVDESMLTGESVPVEKKENDGLIGGSINVDGSLEMQVKNTGENSYLSKVINLVREAQKSKSKTQLLADKAAFWLTMIALTVGFSTLAAWLSVGQSITFAIERMATVMVITCPHALGLAIPLVVAMSTSLSAKNGLLIKNRTAFENARNISIVVFDKTGTLTEGKFGVSSVKSSDTGYGEKEIIQFASALEKSSEHPIARGILDRAQELGLSVPDVSDFEAIKGKGVKGIVDGKKVKVVSPGYLKEAGIDIPDHAKDEQLTVVFVLKDEKIIGTISLSDRIREDSYDAIQKLKELGIKCWMLTGDNNQIAKKVHDELNLDGYFAEVLPHEKLEKIKELQSQNEYVAMTGDGVNDAPALAQADVGIAIGSGTDIAAETADIILVESNPKDVTSLIIFGRATYKKMIQNLVWATGYNLFAIPLAAGVFYRWGIIISPAVGAILMSLSTVIVAINAKLLKVD